MANYPIICLAGYAGAGKDFVADLIVKNNPNCCKIALADPIKEELAESGIPRKYLWGPSSLRNAILPKKFGKGTVRNRLQIVGTLGRRQHGNNYWAQKALNKAKVSLELVSPLINLVVIPDLRYRNEILFFKSLGAKIFKIESTAFTTVKGKNARHSSETELATVPDFWYDGILHNDPKQPKKQILQQLRAFNLIS